MLDPITKKELVRFLTPAVLGFVAYLVTCAVAQRIFQRPRQLYFGRLVLLLVVLLLGMGFYLPYAAVAFTGPSERWYTIGGEARGMGSRYGVHTIWIWFILALMKWPKKIRNEKAT